VYAPPTEIFSLRVNGADIKKEPGFSNARLVWSARNALIAPNIQLRALRTLTKGPMSLEALCAMLTEVPNPMAIISALACRDLVELELLPSAAPRCSRQRRPMPYTPFLSKRTSQVSRLMPVRGDLPGELLAWDSPQ
jgi:hypothetical protein